MAVITRTGQVYTPIQDQVTKEEWGVRFSIARLQEHKKGTTITTLTGIEIPWHNIDYISTKLSSEEVGPLDNS